MKDACEYFCKMLRPLVNRNSYGIVGRKYLANRAFLFEALSAKIALQLVADMWSRNSAR